MVKAFVLEDRQLTSILDEDLGLIDDKLLHIFNDINRVYDKMRDLEWESAHD